MQHYPDNGSNQRDVLPDYATRASVQGNSDFDHRHVAVINVIYELPFFRDKSRWSGKRLGGWQITEVTQFQTGSPVSIQTNEDIAGVGGAGIGNNGSGASGFQTRYLINGNIAQPGNFANVTTPGGSTYSGAQYYAFQNGVNVVRPAAGTFSQQLTRNQFYQPGFQNWNIGAFKDFYTTEKQFFTFRFEAFNWVNHPNLGGATGGGLDTDPRNATFGQITFKNSQRQLQLSLRYTF